MTDKNQTAAALEKATAEWSAASQAWYQASAATFWRTEAKVKGYAAMVAHCETTFDAMGSAWRALVAAKTASKEAMRSAQPRHA